MFVCTAVDEAGNESRRLLRRIYIDASCPDGDSWCSETVACEEPLMCMPKLSTRIVYVPIAEAYVPPVDNFPPLLRLILLPSDTVLSPASPGPHILETTVPLGPGYVDPRWEALDTVDGDVSNSVSALGLSTVTTAAVSSSPTAPDAPLMISYNVLDAAGNSASAVRLVHLVCGGGEDFCSTADGSPACTVGGVCNMLEQAEEVTVPATVELVGPAVVYIPAGQRYLKCNSNLPLELLCDQVCLQTCNPSSYCRFQLRQDLVSISLFTCVFSARLLIISCWMNKVAFLKTSYQL